MAIVSFACKRTEALWAGERVAKWSGIQKAAMDQLLQLEMAGALSDLRVPPGNRLEALKGKRSGQHSIRINDQFRICFVWTPAGAAKVEIVDYH